MVKKEQEQKIDDGMTTRYSFPSVVLCPYCQVDDTEAYHTEGKYQYRRCRRGHCRRNFRVTGTPVKVPRQKKTKSQTEAAATPGSNNQIESGSGG